MIRLVALMALAAELCVPALGASGLEAVYQVIASNCDSPRGGGSGGTAFAVEFEADGNVELRFVTALHVVIGCRDLALYLEMAPGQKHPTAVKVRPAYVDVRRDVAALALTDAAARSYFHGITPFRLAKKPAQSEAKENVTIVYYSNNSYKRDQRETTVTIWPPLDLKDITRNLPSFDWAALERAGLNFLDTQVIRMGAVAWPGVSGAPLVWDRMKAPVVLGVVDGGVHDRLQWAIPAWEIQWQAAEKSQDQQEKLLAWGSKIRLFSEPPVREEPANGSPVAFVGLPPRLLGDNEGAPFVFVQDAELSNAQAGALGSKGAARQDMTAPFVTRRIREAVELCQSLHAELLHEARLRKVLENALKVDERACFSNLGDTAVARGCNGQATGGDSADLDKTESVAYGVADGHRNHLGLRNLIGNAWEWTSEGTLAGGAADTTLAGKTAEERAAKLTRKSGEGTVRCVQRH